MTENIFRACWIAAGDFIQDVVKRHFSARNALAAPCNESLGLAKHALVDRNGVLARMGIGGFGGP